MFCPKCGYDYKDSDCNFCPKCGAPLNNQPIKPDEEDTFIKKPFRDEYGNRITNPAYSTGWKTDTSSFSSRKKTPGCLVAVGIAIGLFALFSIIGALSNGSEYTPGMTYSKKVEYIETTVDQLYDDLDANSMRAKEAWNGQYIKVVGRLNSIDSDGAYLTIAPSDSGFSFNNLQCSIPDALQDQVKNLNIDDIVLVQAQIDMVGDILGYHADLIWIQAAE